jgi:cytosine/adenosine deaminase-related metal-dependent hydrolase
MLRVKNPIFLESIQVDAKALNIGMLNETVKDFKGEIIDHVFGLRQGFFSATPEGAKSIGEAFDDMGAWVDKHYA